MEFKIDFNIHDKVYIVRENKIMKAEIGEININVHAGKRGPELYIKYRICIGSNFWEWYQGSDIFKTIDELVKAKTV